MDLQTVADRIEINDFFTKYATAVDSKDWAMWRTLFTEDATLDYRATGGIEGDRETVGAWLAETLANFPMTQHLIGNVAVELHGDTATVRSMLYNPMGMPDGSTFFCGGWYNHELVRTPEGWKSRMLRQEGAWFDGGPGLPDQG